MITFTPPIAPSIGTGSEPEVKVLNAQFGDGYSQRASDGVNWLKAKFTVPWDFLTDAEANEIEGFFIARRGVEPFLWTPPGSSTPVKLRCPKWSKDRIKAQNNKIRASFEQVNDLP